jgi:hypothetical protein
MVLNDTSGAFDVGGMCEIQRCFRMSAGLNLTDGVSDAR